MKNLDQQDLHHLCELARLHLRTQAPLDPTKTTAELVEVSRIEERFWRRLDKLDRIEAIIEDT